MDRIASFRSMDLGTFEAAGMGRMGMEAASGGTLK